MGDTVFYLMSVVDMDMAIVVVVTLTVLEDVHHLAHQFLQAPTRFKRCRHHRHTHQRRQRVDIKMVAAAFRLVKHVQGYHHTQVHIHQLRRQIQVTFNIRRIYHVDDDIWRLFHQLLSNVQFFGRIGRQRIGTWQVHQLDMIALKVGKTLLGIYRHTAVVAHALMRTRSKIEQRGLATVRIAHQGH